MTADTGMRLIPADIERIRDVLLDPLELPAWNPAFLDLRGPRDAVEDQEYALTALRGLRGTFAYTHIGPTTIAMTWQVPGMRERCTWTLLAEPAGTVVTHELSRTGPVAAMLRHALSGLSDLRLERLAQRV